MNFFDVQTATPTLSGQLADHAGLIVACYCAAWCNTCTQYRPGFEALAEKHPEHIFMWVDIEENEALLDDEDVENFPTVLIQGPKGNLFFGTMLPHIEHLDRLLQGLDASQPASTNGPGSIKALVAAAAQ